MTCSPTWARRCASSSRTPPCARPSASSSARASGPSPASLEKATAIPYGEIPHFPRSTAVGHSGELVVGHAQGVPVAVMAGRAHSTRATRLQEVVFPVRVLGRMGVKTLILTNAAGSVNVNYKPGELMVIGDHINLMGGNPHDRARTRTSSGQRFFDMSEAYDPRLREIAEKACWKAGVTVRKGVYLALSGPSYETPAEIRMLRTLGADAVGMSTVPEVIAARHMGMRVLGISCITNMAAGVTKKPLDHREVLEVGEKVKAGLIDVLGRIIQEAAKAAWSRAPPRAPRRPGREIVRLARAARERAHAPFSGFKVGAALRTKAGEVVTGCNIENATYGLTLCAERVAVFKAVSEGMRGFDAVAVVVDSPQARRAVRAVPADPLGVLRRHLGEDGEPAGPRA